MNKPLFRVRPYSHAKYRFVVRSKQDGKWKRSYFENEAEAIAYARKQNRSFEAPEHQQSVTRTAPPSQKAPRASTKPQRFRAAGAQQKAIIVLGMHRSGTSALGGALSRLGIDFGQNLTPPADDNEKGYWEHPEIVALHDELLRGLNTRWDDDKPLPEGWLDTSLATDIQSLLIGILERDFHHAKVFGLKDPRMCRLMPLWFRIFEAAKIDPYFILVFRHPFEVAESLAKRNGLDHAKSYLLWLTYTLEAERATRSQERFFVGYGSFLEDPVGILSRVRATLGIDFRPPGQAREALRQFVEPSLRHHDSSSDPALLANNGVPSLAFEIYESMRSAADAAEVTRKIAPLSAQFAQSAQLFYPRIGLVETKLAALDANLPPADDTTRSDQLVRLEVFHPTPDGYRATESQTRYFKTDSWKVLTIDLSGRKYQSELPLRIDPVSYPAVIDIAEIGFRQPASGELAWCAGRQAEFASFETAGTACRLEHERYLRIFSFGNDPQLLLPPETTALLGSALRLEISIRVNGTADAISSALRSRQPETPEAAPLITIFGDQGQGYSEQATLTAPIKMGVRQLIRFPNIEQLHPLKGRRWRIDPINQPAVVNILSIQIIHDPDNTLLYKAESSHEFQAIECSPGLLKHNTDASLLLIATSDDPQLFLPPIDAPAAGSCRMEIVLEVHPASQAVTRAAVLWEKTHADLTASLRASQAEINRQNLALEASQAEINRQSQALQDAAAQFQAKDASLEVSQAELNRQGQTIREGSAELQASQTRIAALEAAIATWQQTHTDLQASLDAVKADLADATRQGRLKEAQIKTLQNAVTEAHARWNQLASELTVERAEKHELRQRTEEAEAALENALDEARSDLRRLSATNEELRAHKERLEAEVRSSAEQIADLNVGVEVARTQWNRVAAELRGAEFQNGELQAQTELDAEQIAELEERQRDLRSALEKSENEASRLAALLNMQKASKNRLELCRKRLEQRLRDIAQLFFSADEESRQRDYDLPALMELISADIKSIGEPSLGWRLARIFGLLRLSPAGIPRTTHDRRAIARDLSASLREIRRTLASATAAPEEAAAEIPRLFQLRRQTRELRASLELPILRRKSPVWNIVAWRRRAGANQPISRVGADLFDGAWYLAEYPDVAALNVDPLQHYLTLGAREGRNPNPVFDTRWYLAKNPDVKLDKLSPLQHYWETGAPQGRNPGPLFDGAWYSSNNPDVAATGVNPLHHFLTHGIREGRDPHPLFDSSWYQLMYPEVSGLNPIEHYLKWGGRHGLSPHPLFDAGWYLKQYGDVAQDNADPLIHYVDYGGAEGRNPHPLFDTQWYLKQVGNSDEARANPLRHYVLVGARERRSPTPLFDPAFYAAQCPEATDHPDLLVHYLTVGWRRGYQPSASFDVKEYLRVRPDVARRGIEPLSHWVTAGKPA